MCDRVIIINQGKIVASDTPENLSKRLSGTGQILLRVLGTEDEATKLLERIQGVEEVIPQGSLEEGTLDIVVKAGKDTDIRRGVFDTLSKAHLPVLMMRPIDMSLEEIFLHLTTQEQGV